MIGEKLTYYSVYQKVTDILRTELSELIKSKSKFCISIRGESRFGKSGLAYTFCKDLNKQLGLKGIIFHRDDYFKLPRKENHNARVGNISQFGTQEVDLTTLYENVLNFQNNIIKINKPLVNSDKNQIGQVALNASEYDFCIPEGAYTSLLINPDYKIFMNLTYIDTKKSRLKRSRNIMNVFNEHVLCIENMVIKQHDKLINMIIDSQLNIKIQ